MADVYNVQTKMAADLNALLSPLVGQTYTIPSSTDAGVYGIQTAGALTVHPDPVALKEIMQRLESEMNDIGVEPSVEPVSCNQYIGGIYDAGPAIAPKIVVTQSNNAGTLSGTLQTGDVVGVIAGQKGASYRIVGDEGTVSSVAALLNAKAVAAGISSNVVGATVTIARNATPIKFSVGGSTTVLQEVSRNRSLFCANLLCPNVFERNYYGTIMMTLYDFGQCLVMPDGSQAQVLDMDSIDYNDQQVDMTYIRRGRWLIEYITTRILPVTQVVAVNASLTAQAFSTVPLAAAGSLLPSQL